MNKKVKPPKYPIFYMWEKTQNGTIAIWYPDGTCEILNNETMEWEIGNKWFHNGSDKLDIKICEIRD